MISEHSTRHRPGLRGENGMMIYKLVHVGSKGYDVYDAFVILAENESEARRIAADNSAGEGSEIWMSNTHSSCTVIGVSDEREPGVVLGSFNAA